MKEAYVFLCGRDYPYLRKLASYLQAHRVLCCEYRIGDVLELEKGKLQEMVALILEEGEEYLYEKYRRFVPTIWFQEQENFPAMRKYQSAKTIGVHLQKVYQDFHQVKEAAGVLCGVISLGEQVGLSGFCRKLAESGKRALVVNLEFFSLFPGQEDLQCMNLSDFAMERESEIYREEFPLYTISEKVMGIQCPTCIEDYEEILTISQLTFLQELGVKLGVERIYLYFGKDVISWFPLLYHCQELMGFAERKEKAVRDWFESYWKKWAKELPVRWLFEGEDDPIEIGKRER